MSGCPQCLVDCGSLTISGRAYVLCYPVAQDDAAGLGPTTAGSWKRSSTATAPASRGVPWHRARPWPAVAPRTSRTRDRPLPRRVDHKGPPRRRRPGPSAGRGRHPGPGARWTDPAGPAGRPARGQDRAGQATHESRCPTGRQGILLSHDPPDAARPQNQGRHPRAARPARPSTPTGPLVWMCPELRPRGLQGPQRRRAFLRPDQAMEGLGHAVRQARDRLPLGRGPGGGAGMGSQLADTP